MMRNTVIRLFTSPLGRNHTITGITFCQLRCLKRSVWSGSILPAHKTTFWLDVEKALNTRAHVQCKKEILRSFSSCTSVKSGESINSFAFKHDDKRGREFFGFRFISQNVGTEKDKSGEPILLKDVPSHDSSEDDLENCSLTETSQSNTLKAEESSHLPEMSRTVYNLGPYVQKSETLQNLVKLGVNLSKVEKVKGIANLLMMSDFDRDILPYLHHLVRVGVAFDKLGYILTVNPLILTEHLEHLEQRVGYLVSKEFTVNDVASMYTRAPVMILMDPVKLDEKLGFLQQSFGLTGYEVRQVALTFPKILPWRKEKIADIHFSLKEFMGFDDEELKLMLLREPKLFTANIHKVQKTFDYIHNTMLVPHSLLVKWPSSLRSRLHIVKGRHLFLVHLGRAQYDPYKENYVSLKSLIGCTDNIFCENVAKSTEDQFNSFLKML